MSELQAVQAAVDLERQHLEHLLEHLTRVRAYMLGQAAELEDELATVHPNYSASARNLAHYLALCQHDLRALQDDLAAMGLSSLGRCESHALASIDAVIRAGRALLGESWRWDQSTTCSDNHAADGHLKLIAHTQDLFGPQPLERGVRIMVTLPMEAGDAYTLVRTLVASGMDCARINCAHDNLDIWRAMAANVRRAARETGRACRVLVDVAGPKLRTGDLPPGPTVVVWKPRRNEVGAVVEPASIWFTAGAHPPASSLLPDAELRVPATWLEQLTDGDKIELRDARGKRRRLVVIQTAPGGWWAQSTQTAYLLPRTRLRIEHRRHSSQPRLRTCAIGELEPLPGSLLVRRGDVVIVGSLVHTDDGKAPGTATPRIACSLPADLNGISPGDPIWFDDGKIGGRIRRVGPGELEVQITQAKAGGSKLRGDRSVNLPESKLARPQLLPKDVEDLGFVADHADMVGLSFAESPEGIQQLVSALRARTDRQIGIVLKIETRRGFERLPQLLFAAMRTYPVGVMIARGDLAVECGYERLAEVQEEILWLCEAAHLPVIWATQVLDQLTRTGQPSRAEITDAAMSGRSECVMLNKGPHVLEAVRALGDILVRMQAHQRKKRSLFRKLRVSELDSTDE